MWWAECEAGLWKSSGRCEGGLGVRGEPVEPLDVLLTMAVDDEWMDGWMDGEAVCQQLALPSRVIAGACC